MLEIESVSFAAGGRDLVHDISLAAVPGEMLAIAGPNGAGKSTLLRVATGEFKPRAGSVRYDGAPIHSADPRMLAAQRAVVPQATNLAFPFTVGEVVRLGVHVPAFNTRRSDVGAIVHHAMTAVDINHLSDRHYVTLSGGERQRTHLARALCQLEAAVTKTPKQLLLLDEPTASLDLAHQLQLFALLKRLAATGLTIVTVLHDLNLVATYADKVVLLSNGALAAHGTPADVMTDSILSRVFDCQIQARPLSVEFPCVLPQFCEPKAHAVKAVDA